MELPSFEETIPKKLERVIQNQELLLEQLQAMSREPVKSIEEAVDKTLAKVNSSQLDTIEKVNNVQSQVDKITGNQSRLASGLNELKTEITNRTFLQNELSKDLDELSLFVKSGRSPSRLIGEKLSDLSKELFMIGVHQNEFTNSMDDYRQRMLTEIQKMTIDLSYVVDKRLENEEEKAKILDKIKALNERSVREGKKSKEGSKESPDTNGQSGRIVRESKEGENERKESPDKNGPNGEASAEARDADGSSGSSRCNRENANRTKQ